MRELSQKARFAFLFFDIAILAAASQFAFGQLVPTNNDSGIWFYTALLGLLLGSRLDTPFFVTPKDVFLYAAPAIVAMLLANSWATWPNDVRAGFAVAVGFCAVCLLLASLAIVFFGSTSDRWQHVGSASRVLAETLGTPRIVYSVVVAFALFAFHRDSPAEFSAIAGAWILTGILSPFEGLVFLWRRLRRTFNKTSAVVEDGEVVAFQTPGLLLVRQSRARTIKPGALLVVRDVVGSGRLAVALDHVGRDEGILVRALELTATGAGRQIAEDARDLRANGVACVPPASYNFQDGVADTTRLVGLVAPDTTIERLYFEVVNDDGVEEGRLVDVQIRGRQVLYQVVNGVTREEVVRQRNTRGFARAQAQKIGVWDGATRRFEGAKWLPRPNAPVYLRTTAAAAPAADAIGHFPGTDYGVRLKSESSLVTHNTAILGILGVGKSSLAFELIERIIRAGIKVVSIDITSEHERALADFLDAQNQTKAEESLKSVTAGGKTNFQQNVEEGGSRTQFATKVGELMKRFLRLEQKESPLLVLNPSRFEVWRQDSKIYAGRASMATVSSAEIAQIISESALEAVMDLGMTDSARLCIVYEEAHSLVPEWNSTVTEGDKAAANGTARAILQGRKYGMGCLLVTQRTANVTKTILNQCNTVFAMRTFDDTGKGFLANYVGSDYAETLPSLSERCAVFFGRASSCENPVLLRLNDREDFLKAFRSAVVGRADAQFAPVSDVEMR